MANEFIIRKGFKSLQDSELTGSLNLSGNIVADGTVQAEFASNTSTAISGAFNSVSSSLASELLKNTTDTLTGDLTVTGTLTAQDLHVQEVTSSIVYSSGSNVFGSLNSHSHDFTGTINISRGGDRKVSFTDTRGGKVWTIEHDPNQIYLWNSTDSEAPIMFKNNGNVIMNAGSVGIGTDSTNAPLAVVGTGAGSVGTVNIKGSNAHLGFTSGSGTFRSWVGHFDTLGHGSEADLNIKTGYGTTGNIRFTADGDTTAAQMYLQGSSGHLGIGTTDPGSRRLSVHKNTAITAGFNDISEFLDTTLGVGGSVSLNVGRENATRNLGKMAFKYAGDNSTSNALNFGFYDADNLMTILANGSVGIGTTSPSGDLEISGSGNSNRTITFNPSFNDDISISSMGVDANNKNAVTIGQANSQNNSGVFRFHYAGAGSTSNYIGLGFYANDDKLVIYPGGTVDVTGGNLELYQNKIDGSSDNLKISADFNNVSGGSTIEFLVDGDEKARIDNAGRIGIGTTDPNHALDIYSNTNVPLRIHRPSNANLDSSGAWGIGFSTRGDTVKSTTDTRAGIFSAYNGDLFFAVNSGGRVDDDPDGNVAMWIEGSNKNIGIGTTSPTATFTVGHGSHGVGTAYLGASSLPAIAGLFTDSNTNGGSGYGDLHIKSRSDYGGFYNTFFHTAATNNTPQIRMTIRPDGNIGIGTTSPRAALEVDNNSDTGGDVLIVTTGANNGAEYTGIRWDIADGSLTYGAIRTYLEASGYSRLAFLAGDNAGNSLSEYMCIAGEGKVGIGTTQPGTRLTVASTATGDTRNLLLTNLNDTDGDSASLGFSMLADNTYVKGGIMFERTLNAGRGNLYLLTNALTDGSNVSKSDARLTVQHDGKIGINTTSPSHQLEVNGNVQTGQSLNVSSYSHLGQTNSGAMTILAHNARVDTSNNNRVTTTNTGYPSSFIKMYYTQGISFHTTLSTMTAGDIVLDGPGANSYERMRVTPYGITFNGDTAAANAIDDYEEGTWTPVLTTSSTVPTVGYAYRSGDYTKIGNIVFCRFGFKVNSISGGSGTVRITGLPYTHSNQGAYQEPNISVQAGALSTADYAYRTRMFVANSSTYLEGRIVNNSDTSWNISEMTSTSWIIGQFFYHVN